MLHSFYFKWFKIVYSMKKYDKTSIMKIISISKPPLLKSSYQGPSATQKHHHNKISLLKPGKISACQMAKHSIDSGFTPGRHVLRPISLSFIWGSFPLDAHVGWVWTKEIHSYLLSHVGLHGLKPGPWIGSRSVLITESKQAIMLLNIHVSISTKATSLCTNYSFQVVSQDSFV